jgi:pSer/pThr/pTyr-binding forkhead associated (FHA) protein
MSETAYNVVRQGVAGAGGGMVAFLLQEPWLRAQELAPERTHETLLQVLAEGAGAGALIGALVAAALTFGDELGTARAGRIARRTALALVAGGLIGAAAGLAGQIVFSVLLPSGIVMAARALSWALIGAGIGLAGGAVSGSAVKMRQGMAGGAIGGLIGGGLFDIIAIITVLITHQEAATASRLVGFTVMGICIGVAVALVQEIAKRAWLTVRTGSREGMQYVVNKPEMTIGRDELADVPLFGDTTIARRQALLSTSAGGYTVREVGDASVLRVDGQPAATARLQDGSLLELGRHRLTFHCRAAAADRIPFGPELLQTASYEGRARVAASPPLVGSPVGPLLEESPAPRLEAANPAGLRPPIRLRAEAGPLAGAVFLVPEIGCRLGRGADNEICLAADAMVSRQHAEIFPDAEGWVIRDVGSRNGTAVNEEVVTEAWINPGDEIRIGGGAYRVEEA